MTASSLSCLADQLTLVFGGVPRILDDGEYGSAALVFDGWHRLLVRRHPRSFTVSFPAGPSWNIRTFDELRGDDVAVFAALAAPPSVSLADAIITCLPVVASLLPSPSIVSFPGTPVPAEAWLKNGDASIGFFQESGAVRVVIWAEKALSTTVKTPGAVLDSFLGNGLAAQATSIAAARAEAARKALLPLPDIAAVIAVLQRGVRITTSGGRYHETWFWEAGLKIEIFDEGHLSVAPGTRADLHQAVLRHPDVFREALAQPA